MKSYKVTITETLEKVVEVKAPSREDAELLVERNWKNSEYVLDADNYTGVTFQAERCQRDRGYDR